MYHEALKLGEALDRKAGLDWLSDHPFPPAWGKVTPAQHQLRHPGGGAMDLPLSGPLPAREGAEVGLDLGLRSW